MEQLRCQLDILHLSFVQRLLFPHLMMRAWWSKTRWNLSTDVRSAVLLATGALLDAGQLPEAMSGDITATADARRMVRARC